MTDSPAASAPAGFQPTVDVMASERVRLDAALAHEFGCVKGTEVSRLVRVFRATGTPAVLIEDHFAPQIDVRKIELDRYALDMIAGGETPGEHGRCPRGPSTTAVALPADKAALLGLPAKSPALHTYSIMRSELGAVIAIAGCGSTRGCGSQGQPHRDVDQSFAGRGRGYLARGSEHPFLV